MPNLHEFDLKLAEEQKIKCCVKDQCETVVIRPVKSHSKLELCFYTKKKYWVCAKLHMMQLGAILLFPIVIIETSFAEGRVPLPCEAMAHSPKYHYLNENMLPA